MPRPAQPHGLKAVAAAAGVSLMTVSRVLRNAADVAPRTRAAVRRAAKQVGYRPDPRMGRLMHLVRSGKQRRAHAAIAVIRDDLPTNELHDPAYQYVAIADIRRRSEQHGYHAEEFFLGTSGLTPARLCTMLRARGVEGVLVSPQSSLGIVSRLDYSQFAAATFGYGLQSPALHRASSNMTSGILGATKELGQRGYRRIGLAVTRWIDLRADHTYYGAMLYHHQNVPQSQRVPILLFPEDNPSHGKAAFCAWMRRYRPDAVISFHRYVPEWLTKTLGLRIPDDVGLVAHDWTEVMNGLAGIHHRRAYVAAAAVDLIATQLMQNERGVPEVPRQILIPPLWVDGPSVRPRLG